MESTDTTGVGRCFVKAFMCYDSILRQEFDQGLQTLPNLKTLHASATNTALAELEKLHNNCEQNPEALKQHRMQLLTHMENAFETRRRKVEQTLSEDKHKNKVEWEKVEEISALLGQLNVLSNELEHVKQQNAKLLKEKENTASRLQAQLDAQRQHYETLMRTQSEVQEQHYKDLVKSHVEKISQLEQERDQEARRRKAECDKLEAEVERYSENVQRKEEALRAKENELRQLRDQEKRKETELNAQREKLSEVQQRINRNRTRRLEIFEKIWSHSIHMVGLGRIGIEQAVRPPSDTTTLIFAIPSMKKALKALGNLLEELRNLEDCNQVRGEHVTRLLP